MRYGLTLPNGGEGCDPRSLAALAALAEDAGWDGVFLEDYITWQGHDDVPTYDPWLALAAIAVSTHHVTIGMSVTPLPRRRPWKVAREAVTLDHLSGGRFILGVGLGDTGDPGFARAGEPTDIATRARMLDEGLDIITGLWGGEPFSYAGTYYHVDALTFLPRPIQQPRIPIWIGGNWPHPGVMRRSARWDGFIGGKDHAPDEDWHLTPNEARRLKADIQRHRTRAEPFDIALGGGEREDDLDREREIRRSLAEAGATWWKEYVHPGIGGPEAMRQRIKSGPVRAD